LTPVSPVFTLHGLSVETVFNIMTIHTKC